MITPNFSELGPVDPANERMVLLAFSGGGTRAAALAYGVLGELARTVSGPQGGERRLLDEVDAISAVSGGSFTAAYYALYGERIFQDFESRFLKRDIGRALLGQFSKPRSWLSLMRHTAGRSDLASDFYSRELFDGATFGDLVSRTDLPRLFIHATDMVTGLPFAFTPPTFERIGADWASFPIARAVAASSAVPLMLSPITMPNQASEGAVNPFIHLVDGGFADNLGLRTLLDAGLIGLGVEHLRPQRHPRGIREIVVIVVNAETQHSALWNARSHPGITDVLGAVSEHLVHLSNTRLLEILRSQLEAWRSAGTGAPAARRSYRLIEVGFAHLPDPDEQVYFHSLNTSFHLPEEAIDRLSEAGGRLLRQSPEFVAWRDAGRLVPGTGLEPARLATPDPKSGVSANSTTRAFGR